MALSGKTVIVTGAAAGIGKVAALKFAAAGAAVVGVDIDKIGLAAMAREAAEKDLNLETVKADVSRGEHCRKVVERTVELFGSIDILFNNAGVVHQGPLAEATEEEWDTAMKVNVKSMYWMCKYSLPAMRQRGAGSIINMSSVAAQKGLVSRGVYSVSKAAVIGLTKSLAIDSISQGIRVNCICPGTVDTPSLRARISSAEDPEKARAEFIERQPMGRLGSADEIAALALYLACDESAYMTGQVLVIDGGMTL